MIEDVKVSKILELADKYSLKVADYQFSPKFDLKMSCGLLVARVKYAVYNDLVENIEMPKEYTSWPGDGGHRYIMCQGWMNAQGLLLARVNFDNDLIVAIRMPDKYGVFYSELFNRENIGTSGWVDVTTLAQFEKQTKKLIEDFKKCLVKLRKDFLETDFD